MVQVGFMALRGPDGEFLPEHTPIYRDVPVNERGRTAQQERNTEELSKFLAAKFKAYKDDCRRAGIK